MQTQRSTIAAGTIATFFEEVEIGTGNFEVREHLSSKGERGSRLTAALWVYIGKSRHTFDVFSGFEVQLEKYLVKVIDVRQDSSAASIVVEVSRHP